MRNSRELLKAAEEWLGYQNESLSFGLRSAFDAIRLYEYWIARPELPEFCDSEADDDSIDVEQHRIDAIGYDPLAAPSTADAPCGTSAVMDALLSAEQLLSSVAFVTQEGDTDVVLQKIRQFTTKEVVEGDPSDSKAPICEECDLPMHPFATDGHEGWGCDGCGWSFDTSAPEGRKAW